MSQSASDCLNTLKRTIYQNGVNKDGGKTIESIFHTCPWSQYVILGSKGIATYESNVTHVKSAQTLSLKGKFRKKLVCSAETDYCRGKTAA